MNPILIYFSERSGSFASFLEIYKDTKIILRVELGPDITHLHRVGFGFLFNKFKIPREYSYFHLR